MKIKKKMFLMFTCMISIILLLSNTYIYFLFNKSTRDSVMEFQQSTIETNQLLINNFLDSMRETILQLIGDKSIGENLSIIDLEDSLVSLNVRSKIKDQFSHYTATQILHKNSGYKSTLFLNNNLPIVESFSSYSLDNNPYVYSSNIFSDINVVNTNWYKEITTGDISPYIFVNESTDEFCFAQKIQNTYYTGPYYPNGIGVMVISIEKKYLEDNLSCITVSPNSGFALINTNTNEILHQSNLTLSEEIYLESTELINSLSERKPHLVTLNNKKYILNFYNLNYELGLLYLTPYSDIQHSTSRVTGKYLIFSTLITLIILIFIYLLCDKMTRPIIKLSNTIANIDDTRKFVVQALNVSNDKELQILSNSFKILIEKNNQLIENIQKESDENKKSQLRALQAQINPHFIFNAMDIVNWIALSRGNDDIADIVSSIATMMRYTITDPESMVSIQDEIKNIKEYISIYKLRHPCEISLDVYSKEPLNQIFIPKFTLQPLVENSIKHGLSDDNNFTTFSISIRITRTDTKVIVDVIDNGLGYEPSTMNDFLNYKENTLKVSNGFGIRNVNERIQLKLKGNSCLSYLCDENGHLIARVYLDYTNY